ncbi:CcmD family protein [candidate division KSB1 bacterium]|nr:CcmD family protein [candidate division KSB1 bacterium]
MGNGLIYVMAVNIVIWIGIAFYLFSLDRKIKKLEREMNDPSH